MACWSGQNLGLHEQLAEGRVQRVGSGGAITTSA
jgi:hypothetical protein